MKVVFDTNVYVSAFLIPGSQGEKAFVLTQRQSFTLYSSVAILTETAHVFRIKFHLPEEDIKVALKMIGRVAHILKPSTTLNVLQDSPDNRILECAMSAEADLLVTGDRHILQLRRFEGISIVRLVDFLRLFPDKT